MIRTYIAPRYRLQLQLILRFITDLRKGYFFRYARRSCRVIDRKHDISISQALKPNDDKLHNLLLARRAIEETIILPNEIFSFWKIVGSPSLRNGFRSSRSIVGNEIQNTIGGGLCQLSGMIYYVSLLAGLEIVERHSHSIDIYDSTTRFAPLGSDATLVYGYKDLKVRNTLTCPIKFMFDFEKETLGAKLFSEKEVTRRTVKFENTKLDRAEVMVTTLINGTIFDRSVYKTVTA